MSLKQRNIKTSNDRFIPTRNNIDLDLSNHYLMNDSPTYKKKVSAYTTGNEYYSIDSNVVKEDYSKRLADTIFGGLDYSRILTFSDKAKKGCSSCGNSRCTDSNCNFSSILCSPSYNYLNSTKRRVIPTSADRVLDAPDFVDDYYLNLLDWSNDNILAIALGSSVYLWNANNGNISELVSLGDTAHVCSISWAEEGQYLAVGTSNGDVKIYDAHSEKLVCIYLSITYVTQNGD